MTTADFRREYQEALERQEEREVLLYHAVDIVYNLANDELRTFIAQHESAKEIPR